MKARYSTKPIFLCTVLLASIHAASHAANVTPPPLPVPVSAEESVRAEDDFLALPGMRDRQADEIAKYVKEKVIAELRRDGLLSESAAPKQWLQQMQPNLNFLELNGYFRTRANFLYRCDLGTYIPGDIGSGTSLCPPPITYYQEPGESLDDHESDNHGLYTMNMRLRLVPTLNVSEYLRIKGSMNVFGNTVFGSTSNYFAGGARPNPSYPISFLSTTQSSPMIGINGAGGGLEVQRLWGEAETPFGEFRFGRMPLHFGLGILYNNGGNIHNDYPGTNIDAVMFATELFGHYVIPAYAVLHSGPVGRGGGLGANGDQGISYLPGEAGARLDLDPRDNVHSLFLMIGKEHSKLALKEKLVAGDVVWNYALLSQYRFQYYDYKYFTGTKTNPELRAELVERNAHAGVGSVYVGAQHDTLKIEVELAGTVGKIGNTEGLNWSDGVTPESLWLLQGGAALKSRYGILNDKLGIGIDSGIASGNSNEKMNSRPGLNGNQFNDNNKAITTFAFNPNYTVDLLLFREVLGGVAGAVYVKPHVSYDLTTSFSVRGDIISSFALFPSSTRGDSSLLGLEFDLSALYQSTDGFYFQLQYGLLVPFNGLNHAPSLQAREEIYQKYGTARNAQTVQVLAGINF